MGLWANVKGVFGRIGRGIKSGIKTAYNWIKEHMDVIKGATDKAKEYIPEEYRGIIDKGVDTADKIIRTFG